MSAKVRTGREPARRAGAAADLAQDGDELALQHLVAAGDRAGGHRVGAAIGAAGEPARLAYQEQAGGHVPGLDVALPVDVGPAAGHRREVEGGRAGLAHAAGHRHHGGELLEQARMAAAAEIGRAVERQAVGEVLPAGDPQALVVEEGALAALREIELVLDRLVDHRGDDRALALEADRDAEMRHAVQEVGGTVEGVDVPGMGLVLALDDPALLHDQAVARPRLHQRLAQGRLGLAVGRGDEVARAFSRDLQVLDLAEIALEPARRLAHGIDHHGHQGGDDHRAAAPGMRVGVMGEVLWGGRWRPRRMKTARARDRGEAGRLAGDWL